MCNSTLHVVDLHNVCDNVAYDLEVDRYLHNTTGSDRFLTLLIKVRAQGLECHATRSY
jgi:hypothetical protein